MRGTSSLDEEFLLRTLEVLCTVRSMPGKERSLALTLAELARSRGFRVELSNVARDRPNVVIECGEDGGRSLLFSAHLDMQLPPGREPLVPRLRPPWFFGEGVNNMKGGLAAMLAAADCHRATGGRGRISILAAIGEIDSLGRGTVAALRSGLGADAAINGEPTDLRVVLRHAGVARFRITCRGRKVHISQQDRGANAVSAIALAVGGLDKSKLSFAPNNLYPGLPLLNVGVIRGGTHASMLAASAYAEIDVRWAPPMTIETIRADIERHLASVPLPHGIDIRIAPIGPPRFYGPSPFVSDLDWTIVTDVTRAHEEVVGRRPFVGSWMPTAAYGSDAPHLIDAGIATCMYGPGKSRDINQPNERIAWRDVTKAALVYERAAKMFFAH